MAQLDYIHSPIVRERSNYKDVHRCETCPYFSKSLFSMLNHVRRHRLPLQSFDCQTNDLEIYCCKNCDLKFDTIFLLRNHIQKDHSIDETEVLRSYICRNCPFETYSTVMWLRHECIQDKIQEICVTSDVAHIETIEEEVDANKKTQHEQGRRSEKSVKIFQCHECEYKTCGKSDLRKHVSVKHTPDEDKKWFQCDKCSFKTTMTVYLKRHHLRHHSENADLRHHSENADKRFQCGQCEYRTSQNRLLKRHFLARHTQDKDKIWLKCDKCTFKTTTNVHSRQYVKITLVDIIQENMWTTKIENGSNVINVHLKQQ